MSVESQGMHSSNLLALDRLFVPATKRTPVRASTVLRWSKDTLLSVTITYLLCVPVRSS